MQFRNLVKIWSKDFNEKRDLLIQLNEALNKYSKEKKDLVTQKSFEEVLETKEYMKNIKTQIDIAVKNQKEIKEYIKTKEEKQKEIDAEAKLKADADAAEADAKEADAKEAYTKAKAEKAAKSKLEADVEDEKYEKITETTNYYYKKYNSDGINYYIKDENGKYILQNGKILSVNGKLIAKLNLNGNPSINCSNCYIKKNEKTEAENKQKEQEKLDEIYEKQGVILKEILDDD